MFKFLARLFEKSPADRLAIATATEAMLAKMKAMAKPTLLLKAGEGRSKLGGSPSLENAISWPLRNGKPLAFLGELDLAELRAADGPG